MTFEGPSPIDLPDPVDFLGFRWSPVTLDRGPELRRRLDGWPQPLAGFTFAALFGWDPVFRYGWCPLGPDTTLLCFVHPTSGERHLLQPTGPLPSDLAERLREAARALPYPLRLVGACDPFLRENPAFTEGFDLIEDRDGANYLYRATDLALLQGRAYAKKRNLLSQAERLYAWTTEPLTAAHLDDVRAITRQRLVDLPAAERGPASWELVAHEQSLTHFERLGLEGLLVRVEGRATAFAIWERQTPDTAVIHFEGADREVKGLYQVVNRESARVIAGQGYAWINREEDMGDPGMRQAKLSYLPARLEPAWELRVREP